MKTLARTANEIEIHSLFMDHKGTCAGLKEIMKMKKAYVVVENDYHDYEHFAIIGIYSSKALAEKEKSLLETRECINDLGYFYNIQEFEIDRSI